VADLTKEKIEELKQKHGDVAGFSILGQVFVLRTPTRPEFRRCMDRSDGGTGKSSDALEELAASCVVFPDAAETAALFTKKPGIALKLGNKALEMAGVVEVEEVKLLPRPSSGRSATTSRRPTRCTRCAGARIPDRPGLAGCSWPSSFRWFGSS